MANLFDPPQIYDLPLSIGKDLVIDFQRSSTPPPTVTPVNYDAGTTVNLIIDTVPETISAAVITGYHAVVTITCETTDLIIKRTTWRCVVTLPDSTDLVPCNGQTIRFDGK